MDIVHDLEVFPWPIKSGAVNSAKVSHVLEHIKPWLTIQFMNELWRVLAEGANLVIYAPYGTSHRFVQDPTHCNPINETTFLYFDPDPVGSPPGSNGLYPIYAPKPWRIVNIFWAEDGDIQAHLVKRPEA